MLKVALVFPVFNTLDFTKRCLQNLITIQRYKETILPEIVVVDDGSSDGTFDWIAANNPDVHLLQGDGNLWWSGGVNKGVEFALKKLACTHILLWNNDILADNQYFVNLYELLEDEGEKILCSQIYQYRDGYSLRLLSHGGYFNAHTGKYGLRGWCTEGPGEFTRPLKADWFAGMGTTIPKKVFETIGLFDEKNFPQYHGDLDFALRAGKSGFNIEARPELKIWNDRTTTGLSNTATFNVFLRSFVSKKSNNNLYRDILFYRKHASTLLAYRPLAVKYFRYAGGYFKWKILALLGMKRIT